MQFFLWLMALISTVAGAIVFCFGLLTATSAAQQTAAASIALGLTVGPYVLARAVTELVALENAERQTRPVRRAAAKPAAAETIAKPSTLPT